MDKETVDSGDNLLDQKLFDNLQLEAANDEQDVDTEMPMDEGVRQIEKPRIIQKRIFCKQFANTINGSHGNNTANVVTQCNLYHSETYHKGIQASTSIASEVIQKCSQTDCIDIHNKSVQTQLEQVHGGDNNIAKAFSLLQDTEFIVEVLRVSQKGHQLSDFCNLLHCLKNGKLSSDNIAWLCLLDRAKYAACKSTTQMKYRPQTAEFWNIVYLLFGNSALTVFRGPANYSHVSSDQCKRGYYDPQKGSCNFSVPSITTLRKIDSGFDRKIPPGFISVSLQMAEKKSAQGGQFTLSFDAKKVAEGCKNVADGDVDMMGLKKPNLRERLKIFDQQVNLAEELLNITVVEDIELHTLKLLRLMTKVSKLLWHLQRSKLGKAIAFNKLRVENEGNVRSEKRFQYTASLLNVKRHECEINMNRALLLMKRLIQLCAKCKGLANCTTESGYYDLSWSPLAFTLLPADEVARFVDFSQYTTEIKQRSTIWFELRKRARLTGSTMYNAIGLDKFNLQGEHYNSFIRRWPHVHAADVLQKMAYGTANEINAVCTIVSRLLPCHFGPCTRFFETGMKFLGTEEVPNMMEVSADGMIVCGMGGDSCPYRFGHFASGQKFAVEIKCCYPRDNLPHMPYDHMPRRYVSQCLAEMKALECDALIFACWTPTSTAVFLVHNDVQLWNRMWSLACEFYGQKECKPQPQWHPESERIKNELGKFVARNTKLLCIIPSVIVTEGQMEVGDLESPYRPSPELTLTVPHVQEIHAVTIDCVREASEVFSDSHNALRNPAQEVMVWMLNDKDRLQEKNVPNSVPVCYHLKGKKFDMPMARKLIEIVRNKLHEKKVNILTEVYDSQFHPIIVKDKDGNPLTRLQLYKQTWNTVSVMNKEALIQAMMQTSHLGVADMDILRVLHSLAPGESRFTNLQIVRDVNPTRFTIGTLGGGAFPEGVAAQFQFAHISDQERAKWNEKVKNRKKKGTILDLQEHESNLLEAIHPELIDEIEELHGIDNNEEEPLGEDELPDIIARVSPLDRVLSCNDFALLYDILQALKDYDNKKWRKRNVNWLYPYMLRNVHNLDYHCTVPELQIIAKVLQRYTTSRQWYDGNERKFFNVNLIATGFGCVEKLDEPRRRRKKFNPPSLRNICKAELNKPSYPLLSLRASYAVVYHKYRIIQWEAASTVPMTLPVPFRDEEMRLFYYPEYSQQRQQVECRTFDPVHVLTKVRGHLCKSGYTYAKKEAFVELSRRRPDILSRSAVLDVIDPQNAFIAEKFFSEKVEQEIRALGYTETSDFIYLFRFFFRALNERGMSADERCTWLFEMQKFLLKDVSFEQFPPNFGMTHINGMPVKTFEAILQIISSRFTMYGLAVGKYYNMRASTTLPNESFFSDLTHADREGHMYPKAANVSRIISKCVLLNYAKHNPDKAYDMCTSNKAAYPVQLALDDQIRFETETAEDYDRIYRDHFFDYVWEDCHTGYVDRMLAKA